VSRLILADTGPLYALADSSDQYHSRAHEELGRIAEGSAAVAVSYGTLCEAHTLVLRRLGGAYSRQWLGEVLEGAVLINPEPADYALAAEQLDRFEDQPITLVDAVTAVISRRLQIPVWTYDAHFATLRSKLWL
jgi:predicted nucleic acid-binding protein